MTMTMIPHEQQVQNLESYLNEKYLPLTPAERIRELFAEFDSKDILLTSSFGTTAVYLLHLIYDQGIQHPVHFINTQYHFDETLQYIHQLKGLLNLDVVDVKPEDWKNDMTTKSELWKTHPDLCCSINKVEPLEALKKNYKIWISGLMNWQNDNRSQKKIFEFKDGLLKFYPIIDVLEAEANDYLEVHQLPVHPLKPLGYESIGCKHCTVKGKSREGRWAGLAKTECGLHK
ncbi:MAG: phosphoadenylyl-sulfate reductase [Microscillaceae bacterium]|nr:phosphoadenylyl-sulfate reductase [Microscillaceae bacterium]